MARMQHIEEGQDSAMYNAYMGINNGPSYRSSPPRQYVQRSQPSSPSYTLQAVRGAKRPSHRRAFVRSNHYHRNALPAQPPPTNRSQSHSYAHHYDYYAAHPPPFDPRHDKSTATKITEVPSKVGPSKRAMPPPLPPAGSLSRQQSEPDSKKMREMNEALHLPKTPPFEGLALNSPPFGTAAADDLNLLSPLSPGPDLGGLGALPGPGALTYAKTEPTLGDFESQLVSDPFSVNSGYPFPAPLPHPDIAVHPRAAFGEYADLSQMSYYNLGDQLRQAQKEMAELDKALANEDAKLTKRREEVKVLEDKGLDLNITISQQKQYLKEAGEAEPNAECVAFWTEHNAGLRAKLAKLKDSNSNVRVSTEVVHDGYREKLESGRQKLKENKAKRAENKAKNMRFELEVIELTEEVNALKESVDARRHDNFKKLSKQRDQQKRAREAEEKRRQQERIAQGKGAEQTEYPAEVVVQQHLIRAQVEFYFSDYNLKRDKRLLEKICKEPNRGFLAVSEVLALSRVRQLCNSSHFLFESLEHSPYLSMKLLGPEQKEKLRVRHQMQQDLKRLQQQQAKAKEAERGGDHKASDDDATERRINDLVAALASQQMDPVWVGRERFQAPTEKLFPFRRSVFIYGLHKDADEAYIRSMLSAFGGVSKVHFDHGPDTLDRQIQRKMLDKHRVYKLISLDSAARPMLFHDGASVAVASARASWLPQTGTGTAQDNALATTFKCLWCKKDKPAKDGFYAPSTKVRDLEYRVCLQCAAAKSEEQSTKYDARSKLLADDKRLRELLLGLPPRSPSQCKTALCVFASQRQASKCVYVRSRLAYDGAFATHYHHYSKLKKEIALAARQEEEEEEEKDNV